ncbi:FHA domain-containing protein [Laspinema olomoucense]|uniref:FHA domain-containing protein n=1 Tax=Laspinema olomoucense TaxID=3231600 RepID=UPI0021BA7185|nr:FHA domain-containing protein [Laspinema sp. D3d]MCT7974465.1 FHA domain-containing protein [Laspinema sp. D3d]
MNELKLLIEHTGHTYTLKPNREYAIGSASDCEIRLTDPQVSPWHLKFSFDQFSKTWHIYDLGSSTGTLIDNQPISDYPLVAPKRVSLGSGIHLMATPEGSKTTPASQPAPPTTPQPVPAPPPSQPVYAAPPSYPTTMPAAKPAVISSKPDRALIREYFECLKKRRTAPKEQEQLGQKALDDFILSIKEKRWPQKEGRYIYAFLIGCFVLLLFKQILLLIVWVIAGLLFAFYTIERPPNLPKPTATDEEILQWLLMDRENLVKKGKAELRLLETTGQEGGNILDAEPIVLISPISRQLSESNLFDWDLFIKMVGRHNYFIERGLDGEYKYSIYNFIAIYPCQNFIAYYRCTWNFITGLSLGDETCEYLYDSIVSVKTKELSNASSEILSNMSAEEKSASEYYEILALKLKKNNSNYKIVNYEIIEITTTDSQSIHFPVLVSKEREIVDANQTFNFDKVQQSLARNTAHTIRQQVRQRKPGFIRTQSVNEMRQNLLE